ncbi:BLUF domain-containing protein [Sphingomonas qilianensis]|uniref:BLUF domain-containing protein n=1 Tax=Sphingomonas qilianensis TaxID=1736690 RepID=A0ABU9XMY6_9SPHN
MDSIVTPLRQLLYVSSSNPSGAKIDVPTVVEQSRHNNALDGVTGLLWSDGKRFLQVLEGAADSVMTTFARIRADPRHHAIVVLHERNIEAREFGNWTMVQRRPGDDPDALDRKMRRLLEGASQTVRGNFLGLIAARP